MVQYYQSRVFYDVMWVHDMCPNGEMKEYAFPNSCLSPEWICSAVFYLANPACKLLDCFSFEVLSAPGLKAFLFLHSLVMHDFSDLLFNKFCLGLSI